MNKVQTSPIQRQADNFLTYQEDLNDNPPDSEFGFYEYGSIKFLDNSDMLPIWFSLFGVTPTPELSEKNTVKTKNLVSDLKEKIKIEEGKSKICNFIIFLK